MEHLEKELLEESLRTDMCDTCFEFIDRAEKAEAEVERLRKLCGERPECRAEWRQSDEFIYWLDKIDAAGRGEGE